MLRKNLSCFAPKEQDSLCSIGVERSIVTFFVPEQVLGGGRQEVSRRAEGSVRGRGGGGSRDSGC